MDYRKSFIRGLVVSIGLSGLAAMTMPQQQPAPVEIKPLKAAFTTRREESAAIRASSLARME